MTVRAATVLKLAFAILLAITVWILASACFPAEAILMDDGTTVKHDTVYVPSPPDTVILVCNKHRKHCHRVD